MYQGKNGSRPSADQASFTHKMHGIISKLLFQRRNYFILQLFQKEVFQSQNLVHDIIYDRGIAFPRTPL